MKKIIIILFSALSICLSKTLPDYCDITYAFAHQDSMDVWLTPTEYIKKYNWDRDKALELSIWLYNETQTNIASLAKYAINEDVKENVIISSMIWFAHLKKDDETRKLLFNTMMNNPYDYFFKAEVVGAILDFLPEDEVYDFVKDIMNNDPKYGTHNHLLFLQSCRGTYREDLFKRSAIALGLKDFLQENSYENNYIFFDKYISMYLNKMCVSFPERKSILKEAAVYYKDKPEFENELREVKNRIREIEKQEFKIWFRKRWWIIVLSLVFVAGGIVIAVWRRKI